MLILIFIAIYLIMGLITGILSIHLTQDSINKIISHYNPEVRKERYQNLCDKIMITSLIIWPVYFFAIVLPRLVFGK